jgi:signal transduction histidine kinase
VTTGRPFSEHSAAPRNDLDVSIARCRVVLSVLGIAGWYVDPSAPMLTRWLRVTGGTFVLDPYWLSVLFAHLAYSLTLLVVRRRSKVDPERLATVGTWGDVLFGAAVALVTEGETSLYHVFFAFAVVSVAVRSGLRAVLRVTTANLVLYVILTFASAPHHPQFFVMRAAYLAIMGYLVGYLGQARLGQEARLRAFEASAQRERIARSLHDGCVQALAGVNLRLETSSELLRRGRTSDALAELAELQADVNHEHDELRAYIYSLVERNSTPARPGDGDATRFRVHVEFEGTLALVEHALHIILEGARNVHRHAQARTATIDATMADGRLVVAVDDDGRGFPAGAWPPWSIASRVGEVGGDVALVPREAGGHLRIALRIV